VDPFRDGSLPRNHPARQLDLASHLLKALGGSEEQRIVVTGLHVPPGREVAQLANRHTTCFDQGGADAAAPALGQHAHH
jgi:hypothetical protein